MAAQKFFGLDIGSAQIKAVELTSINKSHQLTNVGIYPTPPRSTLSELSSDQEALADSIKKLVEGARIGTPNVVVALPESQIFTRVIEMPPLSDKELASAIHWEAEQYIPMPLNEVSFIWQVLSRPKQPVPGSKMEVLFVAAPLTLIAKYNKILEMADLKPIRIETEILAIVRSLTAKATDSVTTLIASIGASTTDLCIVRNGIISFTRSVATGGVAFTRAVASELNLEIDQAEEYKKTYGLLEDQLDGKIFNALRPILNVVVEEIRRALAFHQGKQPDDPIRRVVLCGGSAKLPGIVVYLASALGLETQIGDPWLNIKKDEKSLAHLMADAPLFAVATGLAAKEIT